MKRSVTHNLLFLPILLCAWSSTVAQSPQDGRDTIRPITRLLCKGSRYVLKANALYYAAGVTNIGAELVVSSHWSIDLPIVYSPYTLARNYRLRFLYIQPEARYWLDSPLSGHFFGVHLNVGIANVSLNKHSRYQTPDGFYGGGISYGYTLSVAKRWSIEFTIGIGYFFTKYDAYYNNRVPIGARYKKGVPFRYWGIDKAGINIVYRLGKKFGKRKEVAK